MQVLDHVKNARIDRILKTFLGFLDGSHISSHINYIYYHMLYVGVHLLETMELTR